MATPRRLFSGGTSISGVIDYAVPLILESQFKGTRRVIDISGDGSNNRGRPAASARDAAVRAGIIINGLPILALEPDLEHYFLDHVIGGPGAFVIAAESYETFADAILKKLIREMATNEPQPYAGLQLSRMPQGFPVASLNGSTLTATSCSPPYKSSAAEAPVYPKNSTILCRMSVCDRGFGLSLAAHGRPGWISSHGDRCWL